VSEALRDVATCTIELTRPPPELDIAAARVWHLLLTLDDAPCLQLVIPSPGAGTGPEFLREAVLRHGDGPIARRDALASLRRRLGAPTPRYRTRSCSVIVCTHRRPRYVPDVIAALGRLDPLPDEVVIVDNAPGELDCRAEAEAAGVRYVREDRKGLDRARSAGLAAARSEIVAFTDDDCVPSAAWLRTLPELFDDPTVAAVTGPAFAHALDTPAQRHFEGSGGFGRGWERRVFDLTTLSPLFAGQTGAGANMIFRRSALNELGEVFPPELDAGTRTESGGDMYALYRVLAAGHRVVYDPDTFVFHQHRPDGASLHRTIRGYGIGLSAVLSKLVVEERELGAPAAWRWLWQQYVAAVAAGLRGRGDPVARRIAWDYLRGGFEGTRAWRAALAELEPCERRARAAAPAPAGGPARSAGGVAARVAPAAATPALSVVIPTVGRPEAARRCLEALAAEHDEGSALEVLLVDDTPPEDARAPIELPAGLPVALLRSHGAGAGAARNLGAAAARTDVLLFLDDDLVARPGLVAAHLAHHRAGEEGRVVVGYSKPLPPRRNLAAIGAALWWEDHFRGKRDAAAMTFVEALSGNMSITRKAWERVGPFDPSFGRLRREDWEWGIRVLAAGVAIVYEPAAIAAHEYRMQTGPRIAAARDEGAGDAVLVGRHPAALGSLPAARLPRRLVTGWRPALALLLLRSGRVRRMAVVALNGLEWGRGRLWWSRLFLLSWASAYDEGFRAGGGRGLAAGAATPVTVVELDSDAPIAPPAVTAPAVEVRLRGVPLARVRPEEGRWSAALAGRIAAAVPRHGWHELAAATEPERAPDLAGTTVLLGPARRPQDERRARAALDRAGARVTAVPGSAAAHWSELDRAAGSAGGQDLVLAMPGAPVRAADVARARYALAGGRVAMVVVVARHDGLRPWPLELLSADLGLRVYSFPDAAPAYVLTTADRYRALGGLDPGDARLGFQAPILELVQSALDQGWVVAALSVARSGHDRRSQWLRRVAQLQHQQARSALIARRASGLGVRRGTPWALRLAAAPVARDLLSSARWGTPPRAVALGRAGAAATGAGRTAALGLGLGLGRAAAQGPTRQRAAARTTPSPAGRPVTRSG